MHMAEPRGAAEPQFRVLAGPVTPVRTSRIGPSTSCTHASGWHRSGE
jgi:hypothetical protein